MSRAATPTRHGGAIVPTDTPSDAASSHYVCEDPVERWRSGSAGQVGPAWNRARTPRLPAALLLGERIIQFDIGPSDTTATTTSASPTAMIRPIAKSTQRHLRQASRNGETWATRSGT